MPKGIFSNKLLILKEDIQSRDSEEVRKVPICVKAEGKLRESQGRLKQV
jgi:hypothetical protein